MNIRHKKIIESVNKKGKMNAIALAQEFGVSIETIRRDLKRLAEKGELHRIHGGAICLQAKDAGNSFQRRQRCNSDAKRQIAEMAVDYVFEGCVISLDASTSSWYFAQMIPNISCTVVTNAMHNISALVSKEHIKTIATGGAYSSKYDAFYGPLSETLLQRLHIDIGIFSCTGLDDSGKLWESNELNASIKRKMFNQCEKAFLLADNSKLQRKSLFHLLDLSQMDIFFTDQVPTLAIKEYCDKCDVMISVSNTL